MVHDEIMLDNLKKFNIVLASNSPRRKELMSGLGVDYVVKTLPDVDESYPDTLQGEEIPAYISREKAEAYQSMIEPDELLITADTIVWMNGEVLGKPKDREDAIRMLRKLSGASHQVITGVCLTTKGWQNSFTVTTDVTFAVLSEEEIVYYVDKYSPMDKACLLYTSDAADDLLCVDLGGCRIINKKKQTKKRKKYRRVSSSYT